MRKYFLLLFFLGCLYLTARFVLVWDRPNSGDDSRVNFTVEKGWNLTQIINELDQADLIRDPFVFKWYIRYHGLGNKLQAGDYVLTRDLTFTQLSQTLQNGRSAELPITIPEGYTIAQIDKILARKNLIQPGDFQKCAQTCNLGFEIESLEGYLFPATYYVSFQGFDSKRFINRLYRTFQQKISPLREDMTQSNRSTNQIIIVASMIEREAFGSGMAEKQKIADVIWKRLDEGIALGIDATTRYEKNDWENPLYSQDFEKYTTYDTRRKRGLPPTAIGSPGLDSIRAAVSPIQTPYYYYLHDGSGQIHFGRNLQEHQRNKHEFLY